MVEQPTDDGDECAVTRRAFAHALGLDGEELEILRRLFAEVAGPLGLDGDLFEGLCSGNGLRSALKLPTGTTELLYARAHHFFSAGRVDRAGHLFRALCILDGGSADNWIGYGVCLRMQDCPEEAEAAFETACRIRPRWAVARFHRLDLAVRQGQWVLAGRLLREFEHCQQEGLPEEIRAEAAKVRIALELRESAAAAKSAGQGAGG